MKHSKIKFLRFNLVVKNLDESLYFYRRFGLDDVYIDEEYGYKYADLELPGCSDDITFRLMEYYGKDLDNPKVTISFAANDDKKITHHTAFNDLLDRGFRFINLPFGDVNSTILNIGELKDPDGNIIELVDEYEGDKYQDEYDDE